MESNYAKCWGPKELRIWDDSQWYGKVENVAPPFRL